MRPWPAALVTLIGVASPLGGYGTQTPLSVTFTDATAEVGVHFRHHNGSSGERYMIETLGSGLAAADLDADGWLDAYFAQGASAPGGDVPPEGGNVLLRGHPSGHFAATPASTGVESKAWSMGVAAADYDADGHPDLYVTNFGRNQLFRNNGDGSFSEIASSVGVDDPGWGASAAWGDIDNDGWLDLYVANYVDFAWDNHKFCGNPRRNLRAYCHPDVYNAVADRLYRNLGNASFIEVGAGAGIADTVDGKGLGVVFGDHDDDGDVDLYVANDSTRNFLYTNDGSGVFAEDGLLAGVAFSADGQAEAGMGTDWGDFDGDQRLDVVVTNLDLETNSLYRNLGDGVFTDVTFARGLGEPSLRYVGFGTNWDDFDNDADLDLFVANGHIIDNIAEFRDSITHAQPNHLYINNGDGEFTERSRSAGDGLEIVKVSRGSATGDFDNDGDLDVIVTNNDQAADYLRNDGGHEAGNWIQLRLVGRQANRTGAGARVVISESTQRPLLRELRIGSSYCSSGPATMHIGLGAATTVTLSVRWPGGTTEVVADVDAGRFYVIQEGRGIIAARPPAPGSGA